MTDSASPDPDLEDLVASCIEEMETDGGAVLERLCEAHPESAARLRERIAQLEELGILHARSRTDDLPERLGPYRVLEEIGRGGMGSVFLAEQRLPVQRRVALKVIRLGMDTRDVLRRFQVERQVLAMLSHPNIAKVFDAGSTPDGRPYFAMEHVDGIPIVDYSDRHELSTDARLELFLTVCDAVQHAHQKGILHRDLKPSNVLVTEKEGRAVPVIIDFGVAKATNRSVIEVTLFTETGKQLGTPEYMSPEQAGGEIGEVDTRTDVYSLGVILYEMLTGALPFDARRLRSAAPGELARILGEEEPPTPSTRVSTLAAERQGGIRLSTNELGTLSRRLRGDLDWIVMKALEKEPARRYPTASELAADLRRHMRDEPVLARPPSPAYRLRKYVRRHRGQVVSASLLLASLLLGLTGTTSFMIEARTVAASERERAAAEGRARARADAYLSRYELLADTVRLREAVEAEAALYPAWPDHIEAMREWLRDRGEPLVKSLPVARARLAELRARARPWTDAQRASDRATHERLDELAAAKKRREDHRATLQHLARARPEPGLDAQRQWFAADVAALERQIEKLETLVSERRTWDLESIDDQFLHDTLAELVHGLEEFVEVDRGALARVRERLSWAERIRALSVDRFAARWEEARAAIAAADGVLASRRYADVPIELAPQLGLVPLGVNPETLLWEFYHLRSAADPEVVPEPDARGRLEITPDTGIVFVLLPGGTFTKGAQNESPSKPNYDPWADPAARLSTERVEPFFIARHEVTQAQWQRLAGGDPPSRYRDGWVPPTATVGITPNHPVEQVSWSVCDRALTRHGLALPTGTQWEFACRAGTTTAYYTGAAPTSLEGHANIADRTMKRAAPGWEADDFFEDGWVVHAPVGSFAPNPWGLFDMHGNVSEWTTDFGDRETIRTDRGGNFFNRAIHARSSYVRINASAFSANNIGVRAARPLRR